MILDWELEAPFRLYARLQGPLSVSERWLTYCELAEICRDQRVSQLMIDHGDAPLAEREQLYFHQHDPISRLFLLADIVEVAIIRSDLTAQRVRARKAFAHVQVMASHFETRLNARRWLDRTWQASEELDALVALHAANRVGPGKGRQN